MLLPDLEHHLIQTFLHHALQDEDKGTVKIMGAGPLLPARAIRGILEEALAPFFVKKLKHPKHLDARQPSSAADDGIVLPLQDAGEDNSSKVEAEPALDDRVGTFKVRGIPFVYPFVQPRAWPWLIL